MISVKKAAVLGAGTMGAQIAAHLANARIPTVLLDIAPPELKNRPPSSEAQTRPLGKAPENDPNRIAHAGFEATKKSKPAAFLTKDLAALVTVGNFYDYLPKLKYCDLIN
jgi:3-hydroxyacyl-CoA dehydrogenase